VTWIPRSQDAPRGARRCLATSISLSALLVASSASAQAAASPPVPPQLRLMQPQHGATIPSDRATVFYRYAPGDATDPVDDGSFQVWVDGIERTTGFRIGNGEAWGTLGAGKALSPGAHLVIARVCSVRGICAAANDVVIAVPTAAAPPDDSDRRRTSLSAGDDSLRVRRHNHWKQPQTLLGDLVSNLVKLFRH
jgi:hypothetical protein